jgi:hypothetical protein
LNKLSADRKYPDDTDYLYALVSDLDDFAQEKFPSSETGFTVRVDSMAVTFEKLMSVVEMDTAKALFSCIFVWIWLTFHMQSCMLSSLGMAVILLSFPFTSFIAYGIFQVKYFGFL